MIINDLETGLAIGDPDRLPFANDLDIDEIQQNIEQRLRLGVASASGIRQIFDATYGDDATDIRLERELI